MNHHLQAPVPWVGDKYQKERLGIRLLLIGESHHGEPEEADDPTITQRVIESRTDALNHGQFFGILEQICVGRKLLVAEVREFWNRVAFMNYAPVLVTEGISVSERHFYGAQARLRDIVVELEPDLVCFFSANAWFKRPWGGPDWDKECFGAKPRDVSRSITMYPFKQREIVMARFNHPRALGAPLDVWHSWFLSLTYRALEARQGRAAD